MTGVSGYVTRVALVAAVSLALVACGSSGPTGDVGKIQVETSSMFVTVTNTAGMALTDVSVAINPVGGLSPYTLSQPRMENGDRRDLSLAMFRHRDGSPFTRMTATPRSVTVSGKDINGNVVQVEVPWK